MVTVSSPEVVWAYEEAMMFKPGSGIVKPIGVSRTDIFFDADNLQKAKTALHHIVDKNEKRSDLKCDREYLDIPLVLLVNENSASASEILAGAVKDMDRGVLVGTTTFGKGLVQRLFSLPDGSALNITIQKYYTPSGTSIHEIGVEPHESVELPEPYQGNAIANIPKEADTQLQKAIEVMQNKLAK